MRKYYNIILLILFLFMLESVMADITFNRTFAITDLPVSNQLGQFNFSLSPNESIYFTLIQSDDVSVLTFPPQITLDENTSDLQFNVGYSIPYFADYVGNETILENIIGITNSVNSNLVLLKMSFLVTHPIVVPNITNETNQSYIIVDNLGKSITVYTFSAIEFNQSHRVSIKAPNGAILDIDCGQFITCQNRLAISANNEGYFDALIEIPEGEIPGNYTSYINITRGNTSNIINFTIIVRGGDIYNMIVYDIFGEECFEDAETLAECYKKQARYNAEIANALINRLEDEGCKQKCDNRTIVNETIKYVEVGNVDPKLLKEYDAIRSQYNILSNDYTQLSSQQQRCIEDKGKLEVQVAQETQRLGNEFLLRKSQLENQTSMMTVTESERIRGILSWVLGSLFFALVVITLIGAYMKANWMIHEFPSKIMVFFIFFVAVIWSVVSIFVR